MLTYSESCIRVLRKGYNIGILNYILLLLGTLQFQKVTTYFDHTLQNISELTSTVLAQLKGTVSLLLSLSLLFIQYH